MEPMSGGYIHIPLICSCGHRYDIDIVAPGCSGGCGARMRLDLHYLARRRRKQLALFRERISKGHSLTNADAKALLALVQEEMVRD